LSRSLGLFLVLGGLGIESLPLLPSLLSFLGIGSCASGCLLPFWGERRTQIFKKRNQKVKNYLRGRLGFFLDSTGKKKMYFATDFASLSSFSAFSRSSRSFAFFSFVSRIWARILSISTWGEVLKKKFREEGRKGKERKRQENERKERKGKERKERKGKERKGKERKEKERKGKERKRRGGENGEDKITLTASSLFLLAALPKLLRSFSICLMVFSKSSLSATSFLELSSFAVAVSSYIKC
jgi:hypothetical protein